MSTPDHPQPKFVKRIVCLANSRKLSGRCIAGREIVNQQPGPWIRPVSSREHQEVSERERHYEDGSEPNLLDLFDVSLIEPRPHDFQQENWLLDPSFYWVKAARVDWAGLQAFVEPDGPLWLNQDSSYNGLNDRIILADANQLRSSLRLIYVDRLAITVFQPDPPNPTYRPKRKVLAKFKHANVNYWLSITDPVYESRFLAQPNGDYKLEECCLTISLGEPHTDGFCYKLVAAIIERGQAETK